MERLRLKFKVNVTIECTLQAFGTIHEALQSADSLTYQFEADMHYANTKLIRCILCILKNFCCSKMHNFVADACQLALGVVYMET